MLRCTVQYGVKPANYTVRPTFIAPCRENADHLSIAASDHLSIAASSFSPERASSYSGHRPHCTSI